MRFPKSRFSDHFFTTLPWALLLGGLVVFYFAWRV